MPMQLSGRFYKHQWTRHAPRRVLVLALGLCMVPVFSATDAQAASNAPDIIGTPIVEKRTHPAGSADIAELVNQDEDAMPECLPPPSDLRAWWPLDETAGTHAPDIWHDANHGTVVGQTGWRPDGKVGGAHTFTGVANSYIDVPDHPSLNVGTGDLTVSAWINQEGQKGRRTRTIIDKRERVNGRYRGYMMEIYQDSHLIVQIANGVQFFTYFAPLQTSIAGDGQWHHVAATVGRQAGSGIDIYLDGQRIGGSTTAGIGSISSASPFRIGGATASGNRFAGSVDEVLLFARALEASEIGAIYDAGSAGLCFACEPEGLIAHWTGDGTAIDEVGGLVGTPVGDTTYEPGVKDAAFSFDGSGDRVVIDPGPESDSFSIVTWIYYKPDLNSWPWKALYARGVRGVWFKNRVLSFWENDDQYLGTLQVPIEDWTHVAITYDNSTCTITGFIDGVQDVSSTHCTSLPSGANLGIGGHLWGPEDFHGLIDDIRVYDRALELSEIEALMNEEPCPDM